MHYSDDDDDEGDDDDQRGHKRLHSGSESQLVSLPVDAGSDYKGRAVDPHHTHEAPSTKQCMPFCLCTSNPHIALGLNFI